MDLDLLGLLETDLHVLLLFYRSRGGEPADHL